MIELLISGFDRLVGWLAAISALLLLAMSVWTTFDVLARSAYGLSAPWFFDLSEYCLVWATFLAAPWVLRRDRHVRIELLIDVLPVRAQRIIGIIVSAIAFAACVVLTWKAGAAALQYYQNNVTMPRVWRIPRIWPYAAVPIGSGLLAIGFLVRLYHYTNSSDPEAGLRSGVGRDATVPSQSEG